LEDQEIVGQQLVPGLEKTGGEAGFAERIAAEKRDGLAVDDPSGGVQRLETLLDERERQRLAEHVHLERFDRRGVELATGDPPAAGGDAELAEAVPPLAGR